VPLDFAAKLGDHEGVINAETIMATPVSIWSGSFSVCGIELRCHVLDTGERVIEGESLENFMAALEDGALDSTQGDLTAFLRWQKGIH
jgi:hypothetical protein